MPGAQQQPSLHGGPVDGMLSVICCAVQVGDYFSFCALDTTASSYKHEVSAIAQAGAPPTPPLQ